MRRPANLLVAASLLVGDAVLRGLRHRSPTASVARRSSCAGCLFAAITYVPIFKGLTHFANPAIEQASSHAPVTVVADPNACSFQFDPVGKKKFVQSCDVAKAALAKAGVPYRNEAAPAGSVAQVRIGDAPAIPSRRGRHDVGRGLQGGDGEFTKALSGALKEAGYPRQGRPRTNQLSDGLGTALHPGAST